MNDKYPTKFGKKDIKVYYGQDGQDRMLSKLKFMQVAGLKSVEIFHTITSNNIITQESKANKIQNT